MGGLPKTKDKNFYENFQGLMNMFLAACGGDAGYAPLLMSESPMAETNKNSVQKLSMPVKTDQAAASIFKNLKKICPPPPNPYIPEKPSLRVIRKGITYPPPAKQHFFKNWPTLHSRSGARQSSCFDTPCPTPIHI